MEAKLAALEARIAALEKKLDTAECACCDRVVSKDSLELCGGDECDNLVCDQCMLEIDTPYEETRLRCKSCYDKNGCCWRYRPMCGCSVTWKGESVR